MTNSPICGDPECTICKPHQDKNLRLIKALERIADALENRPNVR